MQEVGREVTKPDFGVVSRTKISPDRADTIRYPPSEFCIEANRD